MSTSSKVLKEVGALSVGSTEVQTAVSGVIDPNGGLSRHDSTSGAQAYDLAVGPLGAVKRVVLAVDGGNLVVTGAFNTADTTATFADANDALLMISDGARWHVLLNTGAVAFA